METQNNNKLSFFEKAGYALGDGAANIAWRGVGYDLRKDNMGPGF